MGEAWLSSGAPGCLQIPPLSSPFLSLSTGMGSGGCRDQLCLRTLSWSSDSAGSAEEVRTSGAPSIHSAGLGRSGELPPTARNGCNLVAWISAHFLFLKPLNPI